MEQKPPKPSAGLSEKTLLVLLCVTAAARVFVFSAAFPFFNNVDEEAHFDLVMKYGHGEFPSGIEHYSERTCEQIPLYGSPEYLNERPADGKIWPPIWKLPPTRAQILYSQWKAAWMKRINHESSSPPLYYLMAGGWMRLGQLLGISNGFLLYWIRFFDIIPAVLLVWLGHFAAKFIFPEKKVLRLGVPLLLAFFPQDIFYSIQSDVLSSVLFGAAFCGLLMCFRAEKPDWRIAALTGLALAGAYLTKSANLPLLAVAAVAVAIRLWQLAKSKQLVASLPVWTAMFLCVTVPVLAWGLWSRHAFGDFTGAGEKIQMLHWTHKSIAQWWDHPLFTIRGALYFWSDLMATFWRGEFVWFWQRLASPFADRVYWILSLVLPALALVGIVRGNLNNFQRAAMALCLASFAASVAFLAVLSLAFDFGDCIYPSREQPFFTSGRLISGALIPFFIAFVFGLDHLLRERKTDLPVWIALGCLVLLMTVSEIVVNWPAFSSQYNWFHLTFGS